MSSRRNPPGKALRPATRRTGSLGLTLLALFLLLSTTFGEAGHTLDADHSAFRPGLAGSAQLVFPAAAHPWDESHIEDAGEEVSREECPICLHLLRSVGTLPALRPTLAHSTPPSFACALSFRLTAGGIVCQLGPRAPPVPLPC